jgi:hypothetical protein
MVFSSPKGRETRTLGTMHPAKQEQGASCFYYDSFYSRPFILVVLSAGPFKKRENELDFVVTPREIDLT